VYRTERSNDETNSRQSRRSNQTVAPPILVAPVNAALSLSPAVVSVLALNVRGFHRRVAEMTVDDTVSRFGRLVALVESAASDYRGVVDSFHGDHFYCSFNAVKPCVNHAQRAATTGLQVCAGVEEAFGRGTVITGGVAMGRAHVGNLGSASLKRFNTIGAVYTQAGVLERLCKVYGSAAKLATHGAAFSDVEHAACYLQVVDVTPFPGTELPQCVAVLRDCASVDAAIEKPKDTRMAPADGEWLYHVDATREANPFKLLNAAFTHVASGQVKEAAEKLAAHESTMAGREADAIEAKAMAALRRLISGAAPTPPEGYYRQCVLLGA
jgi:class 3 adenylate cyclase